LLVTTLVTVPTARGQVKIYGVEPTESKDSDDPSTVNNREAILTNANVIAMTSLGLSDEIIIEKIAATKTNDFDTSVEGLRGLKANRVSDAVIRSMINPNATQRISGGKGAIASESVPSSQIPDEVGIYVVLDKKLVSVQPEVGVGGSGGLMASALTYGAKHPYLRFRIENGDSRLHVSTTQEFVIRVPDGYRSDDFRLYKLNEKKDSRELRVVDVGVWFSKNRNELDRNALPLAPERIDKQTWRLRMNLEKGEYGFVAPPAHAVPNPDAELRPASLIYTFAVR
jgi:hypothetical protein